MQVTGNIFAKNMIVNIKRKQYLEVSIDRDNISLPTQANKTTSIHQKLL
jgi:hypothetical protein